LRPDNYALKIIVEDGKGQRPIPFARFIQQIDPGVVKVQMPEAVKM